MTFKVLVRKFGTRPQSAIAAGGRSCEGDPKSRTALRPMRTCDSQSCALVCATGGLGGLGSFCFPFCLACGTSTVVYWRFRRAIAWPTCAYRGSHSRGTRRVTSRVAAEEGQRGTTSTCRTHLPRRNDLSKVSAEYNSRERRWPHGACLNPSV